MKKRKHRPEPTQATELGQQYYELWIELNKCKQDSEFDVIRVQMTKLWNQMNDLDKLYFKTLSR